MGGRSSNASHKEPEIEATPSERYLLDLIEARLRADPGSNAVVISSAELSAVDNPAAALASLASSKYSSWYAIDDEYVLVHTVDQLEMLNDGVRIICSDVYADSVRAGK